MSDLFELKMHKKSNTEYIRVNIEGYFDFDDIDTYNLDKQAVVDKLNAECDIYDLVGDDWDCEIHDKINNISNFTQKEDIKNNEVYKRFRREGIDGVEDFEIALYAIDIKRGSNDKIISWDFKYDKDRCDLGQYWARKYLITKVNHLLDDKAVEEEVWIETLIQYVKKLNVQRKAIEYYAVSIYTREVGKVWE